MKSAIVNFTVCIAIFCFLSQMDISQIWEMPGHFDFTTTRTKIEIPWIS